MKQPVKKILSVMFVGCMLLSAAVMQADAVHTAQNISPDNASVSVSSADSTIHFYRNGIWIQAAAEQMKPQDLLWKRERASISVGTAKCQSIQSLSMSIYMTLEKEKSSLPCLRK